MGFLPVILMGAYRCNSCCPGSGLYQLWNFLPVEFFLEVGDGYAFCIYTGPKHAFISANGPTVWDLSEYRCYGLTTQ